MKLSQQEIDEALAHEREMLHVLRQRLRQRELQEAQYGINVPPEITIEIATLTDRIRTHEAEITRLQTIAVEDQLSLAEAEYRMVLAEAWDTPVGHPTVTGTARLEFTRLRLRIPLVQAQELEHEVRAALASEAFSHLTPKENVGLDKVLARNSPLTLNERLRAAIWRAIRLDIPTAAEEVVARIDRKDVVADWDRFRSLLVGDGIGIVNHDYLDLVRFVTALQTTVEGQATKKQ